MQTLDSVVFPRDPTSLRAVLAKMAADQLLWAPAMTCVFFVALKTMEGHPELIESTLQVRTRVGHVQSALLVVKSSFVPLKLMYLQCLTDPLYLK